MKKVKYGNSFKHNLKELNMVLWARGDALNYICFSEVALTLEEAEEM